MDHGRSIAILPWKKRGENAKLAAARLLLFIMYCAFSQRSSKTNGVLFSSF